MAPEKQSDSAKGGASERGGEAKPSGGVVAQFGDFLTGSVDELKKVATPTKQETIQATLVTIAILIFVSLCLFVLDVVFGRFTAAIIG